MAFFTLKRLYATLEEIVTMVEKCNYGRIVTLVEMISVTLVEIRF